MRRVPVFLTMVLAAGICFSATDPIASTIASDSAYVHLFEHPSRTVNGQPRDLTGAIQYYSEGIQIRATLQLYKDNPQLRKMWWEKILAHNKLASKYSNITVWVQDANDRIVMNNGITAYVGSYGVTCPKKLVLLRNLPPQFTEVCRVFAWPVGSVLIDGATVELYDYGIPVETATSAGLK
jgi:hypothetical protein